MKKNRRIGQEKNLAVESLCRYFEPLVENINRKVAFIFEVKKCYNFAFVLL